MRCCATTKRACPSVLAKRARAEGWADTVAGDMERHYSPGRTWEALARGMLQLVETGDVLDIASGDGVLAELLAPRAHSIVCVDASERVVAAARERLKPFTNVDVRTGDMHALDFPAKSFDLVLLLHALTYSREAGGRGRRSGARAAQGRPAARDDARQARAPHRRSSRSITAISASSPRSCASSRAPRSSTSSPASG